MLGVGRYGLAAQVAVFLLGGGLGRLLFSDSSRANRRSAEKAEKCCRQPYYLQPTALGGTTFTVPSSPTSNGTGSRCNCEASSSDLPPDARRSAARNRST